MMANVDGGIEIVSRSMLEVDVLEGPIRPRNVVAKVPPFCMCPKVIEKTTLRTWE